MNVSDFTTIEFLDEENNGEMGGGGLRIILLYNVSLVKLLYISLIVHLFQWTERVKNIKKDNNKEILHYENEKSHTTEYSTSNTVPSFFSFEAHFKQPNSSILNQWLLCHFAYRTWGVVTTELKFVASLIKCLFLSVYFWFCVIFHFSVW